MQDLLAEVIKGDSILHELFDQQQLRLLISSGGETFETPWFGQLMAGPQLLAYLVQFHYWVEDYHIQLIES